MFINWSTTTLLTSTYIEMSMHIICIGAMVYNWTFFAGLIFVVRWSSVKTTKNWISRKFMVNVLSLPYLGNPWKSCADNNHDKYSVLFVTTQQSCASWPLYHAVSPCAACSCSSDSGDLPACCCAEACLQGLPSGCHSWEWTAGKYVHHAKVWGEVYCRIIIAYVTLCYMFYCSSCWW